jgi:hypothetical protein
MGVINSDRRQKRVRKITGRVSSAGAISAGSGFTVVKNGTGDYTITPEKPGKAVLGASAIVVNSTGATFHGAKIAAISASSLQVLTYVADATDGAPSDQAFCFEITLKDVTN